MLWLMDKMTNYMIYLTISEDMAENKTMTQVQFQNDIVKHVNQWPVNIPKISSSVNRKMYGL